VPVFFFEEEDEDVALVFDFGCSFTFLPTEEGVKVTFFAAMVSTPKIGG